MTISVTGPQNIWYNSQSVDDQNLILEQNYNNQLHTSLVGNHIGTGILPEALVNNVIWDSSLSADLLDGKGIVPQAQPTDSANGNQLEIELSGSLATGNKTVKLIIVGLNFEDTLQYDTLVFSSNEKQITSKHYKSVLSLFLNDFYGSSLQSFNLGGRLIIREATPMSISRDPVMISQEVEPNLIWRDFFIASGGSLSNLLSSSLSGYNVDSLNIKTGYKQLRSIVENDVSSQIGQKFLSTSNNIQKISLLLSVENTVSPYSLVWTGDLIISLYALQSTVQSSSDIVPNLAIEFDPTNIPLAQLSYNYDTLLAAGFELDGYSPQPIDFVFSNTPVGSGLSIKSGYYYVVTVKRAGSADTCKIQLATGSNSSSNTRETIFNGSTWVDIPEESLWFKVYYDSIKVSDGQAYDNGNGIQITKTIIDNTTGSSIDYNFNNNSFLRNDIYYALLQSYLDESVPVQNERTGNLINSEKQLKPSVSLLNSLSLSAIQEISEPLILGTVIDRNIKTSISSTPISIALHHFGISGNEIVFKVIDDSLDARYDQNIITLLADITTGKINGSKFIPNILEPSIYYRVVKAEIHDLMYGDLNNDGVIDTNDLLLSQNLLNTNLNIFPTSTEYLVSTTDFVSDAGPLSWELVDLDGVSLGTPITGTDGILVENGTLASFTSVTGNFSSYPSLSIYKLKITGSSTSTNNSYFTINSLISNSNITIEKLKYSSDTFIQLLKTDIDGDMIINSTDIAYITDYVNLVNPFPSTTSPANKIGTTFQAVKLIVEKYIDRSDDYPGTDSNRATTLHTSPNVFLDGVSNWTAQNVLTSPISSTFTKQLNWKENNISVSSGGKMVPASFNLQSGFVNNSSEATNLNTSTVYPELPSFDKGRNDIFVPSNLILNDGGQIITPSGDYHKIDFEMGTISFEIPAGVLFSEEKVINILSDFIADYDGKGYTRIKYPAMRFADNSLVSMSAFTNNQVRVSAGVLSLSPEKDGYVSPELFTGIIVDSSAGVSIDYTTGLLKLKFNNLYQDPVLQTAATRVQIVVYLKKAGFNNIPIVIDSSKTVNLLGL